jgi:hypothetical protein
VLCRYRPLGGTDHAFVAVLPSVCLIVCILETSTMWRPRPELGCCPNKGGRECIGVIGVSYSVVE